MSARWQQLLYTSVDHVVDGRASSGWQVKERSEELGDDLAQELVSLVQPQLTPIKNLTGFPTEAELASADRRLTQRVVHGMPVLLHTAPAGQDTTGRPNTVTHVLVDRSTETSRPLLGAGAWRAPWWSTPYGAEAVRGAALASQEAIVPGGAVTFDSIASLIDGGEAAPVLAALADVIALGEAAAASDRRPLAVLVIETADTLPLWLGALERTCAADAMRRTQWSSLERISSERDLEALRERGFSVVGVPREDLSNVHRMPPGCVVLDPGSPTGVGGPRTPWGRFVQAMASSMAAWITALDALSLVENSLADQRGVTFAWNAAMAQIVSPGLLDDVFDGDVRAVAESIVTTTPVAGAGSGLLGRYLDEVVGAMADAPVSTWYEALASMSDAAPVEGAASLLADRYMNAAVRDLDWMQSAAERAQRPAGLLRRALEAWSSGFAGPQRVRDAVGTAERTLDAGEGRGSTGDRGPEERRARMLVALSSDGISLPEDVLSRFLIPIAEGIVLRRTEVDSQTIAMLPARLLERLRFLVDDRLADLDRPASEEAQEAGRGDEPRLDGRQMLALVAGAADLDRTPYVGLQANLTELIDRHRSLTGRSGGAVEAEARGLAESCMRMLEAIAARRSEGAAPHGGPTDSSITLTGDAAGAVGALFPLGSLGRLSALLTRSQADSIADRIALRDVSQPSTVAWAISRLGGPASPGAGVDQESVKGAGAPRHTSRSAEVPRLILAAAQPVLAYSEDRWSRGMDDLESAAVLAQDIYRRSGGPGLVQGLQAERAGRRLLELVQVRWDAAAVLMRVVALRKNDEPPRFMDSGFVAKAPTSAEEASPSLVAIPDMELFPFLDPEAPLGVLPMRALRRLMEDAGSGAGNRGRSSSRTGRLDPALREAAVAILRAYVSELGATMEPIVHEQLTRMFTMDADAVKQVEQILGMGTSADRSGEKGMAGAVSWTRGLLKRKEERDG